MVQDRQPPRGWGFFRKKVQRCEDCDLRGDLDIFGRPRFDALGRVKDCQGCGGTATVPRAKTSDPMWSGKF